MPVLSKVIILSIIVFISVSKMLGAVDVHTVVDNERFLRLNEKGPTSGGFQSIFLKIRLYAVVQVRSAKIGNRAFQRRAVIQSTSRVAKQTSVILFVLGS